MHHSACGYSDAEFVAIYDACIAESFIDRLFPIIDRLVLKHISRTARLLDLCCGTGNLACRLSHCGYRVTGIDNSSAVLERARQKLPEAEFIEADARWLSVSRTFDAAFCTFNALAHFASAQELRAVFSRVHSSIDTAGFFFFDLNTEEAYRERWRGSFGATHDGTEWQVEPWYDQRSRTAHNRIRLKNGVRACELNVTQHCFQQTEILGALRESGFGQCRSFDAALELGVPNENGHLIFIATKSS
jgi:SAM-dependent methyltransferase